jgi:hypothetical protein
MLNNRLYGVQNGVLINGTAALVTTTGLPSGATFNALAKGSLAFDSTTGITYQKKTDTDSSADWKAIVTTADIDAALATVASSTSTANVTTTTVVASFLTKEVKRATFVVSIKTTANHAVSDSFYVDAEHDGTTTTDAVNINSSGRYNDNLGFGIITGLTYALTLTGTGATQAVNLEITSTDTVDVDAIVTNKLGQ